MRCSGAWSYRSDCLGARPRRTVRTWRSNSRRRQPRGPANSGSTWTGLLVRSNQATGHDEIPRTTSQPDPRSAPRFPTLSLAATTAQPSMSMSTALANQQPSSSSDQPSGDRPVARSWSSCNEATNGSRLRALSCTQSATTSPMRSATSARSTRSSSRCCRIPTPKSSKRSGFSTPSSLPMITPGTAFRFPAPM